MQLNTLYCIKRSITLIIKKKNCIILYFNKSDITKNYKGFFRYIQHATFNVLTDLWACNYPENKKARFHINYLFFSIYKKTRLLLRLPLSESQNILIVDTITTLFKSSAWFEREVWDLFWYLFL